MFKVSKKIIFSGAIGTALEIYDYAIWGLFSVFLAKTFLPSPGNISSIFLLFLATYVLRPISGLFLGILADQFGRKKILSLSIVMMGLSTGFIAILPSYAHIGAIAIVCLIFIRCLQVFSVGGEYISSTALLIESCDKSERGYYGSWVSFGLNTGMMFASFTGFGLSYLMDHGSLPEWGWRLAFLIAFFTAMFGYWIRGSIPESYEFILESARKSSNSNTELLKECIQTLRGAPFESLLVFFLVLFGVSITAILYVFSPVLISTSHLLPNTSIFFCNMLSLLLIMLLIPLFGRLSDKMARTKLLPFAIMTLLALLIPYFHAITSSQLYPLILVYVLVAIPCACIFSVTPVLITELFPVSIRCATVGFLYALAASLGGGLLPYVAFKLLDFPHGLFYLYLLLMVIACFCLVGLVLIHFKRKRSFQLTLVS
jgi:MHS family proline/betaine transporter-like MFS transporter